MRSEDLTLFRAIADGIDPGLYNQLQHPDKTFIQQIESSEYFADRPIAYDFEDREEKMGVSLRYYQRMALYFTQYYMDQHYLKAGNESNKLTYWKATGSGKTIIMKANIIDYFDYIRSSNSGEIEVIITSPLKELIGQLRVEMEEFFQHPFFDAFNFTYKIETTQSLIEVYKKQSPEILGDSHFRLLLVDEAHIGLAGNEKGAFTSLRNELTENSHQSFLFEYSATFYDVSASNKDEYVNRIIYEYDYGKFYNDQYGKDFKFSIVHKDQIAEDEDKDIARNLDENLKAFQAKMKAFVQYNQNHPTAKFPDRPLLVMAGNTVSASDESKSENAENSDIAKIIGYLADKNNSLDEAIFHVGSGILHLFRSTDIEEVLLAYGENVDQFGLITVGNVGQFLENQNIVKLIESGKIILRAQKFTQERFRFRHIDQEVSPINILIGSRKFSAGWNSFRASHICLINFGTGKGSTIVQMFGRGVRLKGLSNDGKRQELVYVDEADGKTSYLPWNKLKSLTNPDYNDLKYLETLFVYSLKSTYLRKFIEEDTDIYTPSITLTEDVVVPSTKHLPVFRINKFAINKNENLECVINIGIEQERNILVIKCPDCSLWLDLPTELNLGIQSHDPVNYQEIEWLEQFVDASFLSAAIEQKLHKNNLVCDGLDLNFILSALGKGYIRINYDAVIATPLQFQKLMIKVIDRTISKIRNKIEYSKNRSAYVFGNIQDHDYVSRYDLRLMLDRGENIREIKDRLDKDTSYKVFFNLLHHYYQPLASDPHGNIKKDVWKACQSLSFQDDSRITQNTTSVFSAYQEYFDGIKSIQLSPDKLDPYEVKFVVDLHQYIISNGLDATILRNKSGGEIGLIGGDEVYFPDFYVWYKDSDNQEHIIFCDPKGIRNSEVKWKVCDAPYAIKEIESSWKKNIHLHSFVISTTPKANIKWNPISSLTTYDQCDVFYNLVFFEDNNYVQRIFNGLTTDIEWNSIFQKFIPLLDKNTLNEWLDDNKREQHVTAIQKIEDEIGISRDKAMLLYFQVWDKQDQIKEQLKGDVSEEATEQVFSEIVGDLISEAVADSIPYIRTAKKIWDLLFKQ